jgi:hypothetical protein
MTRLPDSRKLIDLCPVICMGALAAAVCVAVGAGCQKSPLELVPVQGRILYGGGQWPAGGTILFLPEEPMSGHTYHPGTANFGTDGRFSAGTFRAGDGLVPGTYVVRVECWKVPPTMGGPPPESYLPPAYLRGEKSLPNLVVPADSRRVDVDYGVDKP